MKKISFLALIVLVLGGCSTQTVYVKGDLTGPPTQVINQAFWLGGLGQNHEVDATEICGRGKVLSRVETKKTMTDTLITIGTVGIYAPRTIEISCR